MARPSNKEAYARLIILKGIALHGLHIYDFEQLPNLSQKEIQELEKAADTRRAERI